MSETLLAVGGSGNSGRSPSQAVSRIFDLLVTRAGPIWLLAALRLDGDRADAGGAAAERCISSHSLVQLPLLVVVFADPGSDFNHLVDFVVVTVLVVGELWVRIEPRPGRVDRARSRDRPRTAARRRRRVPRVAEVRRRRRARRRCSADHADRVSDEPARAATSRRATTSSRRIPRCRCCVGRAPAPARRGLGATRRSRPSRLDRRPRAAARREGVRQDRARPPDRGRPLVRRAQLRADRSSDAIQQRLPARRQRLQPAARTTGSTRLAPRNRFIHRRLARYQADPHRWDRSILDFGPLPVRRPREITTGTAGGVPA